ncbi:hypothetical protein MUN82_13165 [Hymenobacter aerilatus]|uniref:Uncharacterized protein n=1 Tax=Hymenobacter aerilatus TaxID=2932251 RepID=A0A8T9SQ16_9BACT|nr:hypothetical protein [Hymenobacter aerilatus]UOR03895.1 hypothetical protein MUN82_13165 [Hymenobacter aerilatus]
MKSVLAFFLALLMLLGSLIPQNDLSELTKLPELLDHYQYHHTVAGGSLSLSEFLVLHYSPNTTHYLHAHSAQHNIEHQKLPLHSHHDCVMAAYVLPTRPIVVPLRVHWPTPALRASEGPMYAFSFSRALLQPPRA